MWLLGIATGRLYLIAAAAGELRRRRVFAQSLASALTLRAPYPGLWRFVDQNKRRPRSTSSTRGILAIGALLDPTAAGIVRVAQQVGACLGGRPENPKSGGRTRAYQSDSGRKRSEAVEDRLALGLACWGLRFRHVRCPLVAFGESLLRVIFGAEFTSA